MEQEDDEDSFSEESFLVPPSQSFLNDTETDRQKARETQQRNRSDLPKKYGVEVKQPENVKKKSKKSSKESSSSDTDESLRGPNTSMDCDTETDRQKARETQQKNRADLPKKYGVEVKQPAVVRKKNTKSSKESSSSDTDESLRGPNTSMDCDTETDRQKARETQQKNRADLPKKYGVEVKQPAVVRRKNKKSSKESSSSDTDESLRGPNTSMDCDTETDRQKARETQQKNRADLPKKYGVEVKQPAVVRKKNTKSSKESSSSDTDESLRGPSTSMDCDTETDRQKARETQQKNRADLPKKYGVEVKQPAVVRKKNKKSSKESSSSDTDESLRGPNTSMDCDTETDRQKARETQQKHRAELAKKYGVEVKQPAVVRRNNKKSTKKPDSSEYKTTKLTNKAISQLKSHIQSVVSSPDTPEVTFQKPARKRTSLATSYRPQNSLSTQSNAYDVYGTVLSQHYNDNDAQSQKILALENAETTNVSAVNKDTAEDSSGFESSSASEDEIANATDVSHSSKKSLLEPSKRKSKTPLNTERSTENSSPAIMLPPPSRKRKQVSVKSTLRSAEKPVDNHHRFMASTPREVLKATNISEPDLTPVSSQDSKNPRIVFTLRKSLRLVNKANPIPLPSSSHENSSSGDDVLAATGGETTKNFSSTDEAPVKSPLQKRSPNKEVAGPVFQPPSRSYGNNTSKKRVSLSVPRTIEKGPKRPSKRSVTFTRSSSSLLDDENNDNNSSVSGESSNQKKRSRQQSSTKPRKRSTNTPLQNKNAESISKVIAKSKSHVVSSPATPSSSSVLDGENNSSDENNASDNNSSVSLSKTGESSNQKKRSRQQSPTKFRKRSTNTPLQNKNAESISKVIAKSKSHVVSSPAAVVDNSEVVTAISESEVDNIETTNDTDRPDSNQPSPPSKKNAKKTTNKKKTKKRRLSSWYPDCPLMKKYGGEVLYNQDILTEDVLKDVVNECGLQDEIPKEKVPALLGSMNTFLEKTFDRLSDETPKSMYYGVFTFQAMLKTMKEEKLVPEDCDEKSLIEMMKKDFSEEDFKAAQGLLYPTPNNTDTLNFFQLSST